MPEVWHKRRDLGEPKGAYDAFTHFRDMPPGARTVDGAYRLHRRHCRKLPDRDGIEAPGLWRKWKLLYQWEGRVDQYDAHVEQQTQIERLEGIRKMNERHAQIASTLQGKVIERLLSMTADEVKKLTPGQLALILDKTSQVERRARGQATDIVKHVGRGEEVADYGRLSNDELEQLERLHAKAEGRDA